MLGTGGFGQVPLGALPGPNVPPANNPPFLNRGRTAAIAAILVAWQPPDPQPHIGGWQPLVPRKLAPALIAVPADLPPVQHFGRTAIARAIATAWQPEEWPYVPEGGAQPYTPRRLTPSITAVPVNDPPFARLRNAPTEHVISTSWQPPAWPYQYSGSAQPYAPVRISAGTPGLSIDNPPFARRRAVELITQAVEVFYVPWVAAQPYAPRRLPPSITAVPVNDPPFARQRNAPTDHVIITSWQPPAWPYQFAGAAQPYGSHFPVKFVTRFTMIVTIG